MKLIKLEGYNLTIEPELLVIKPFKKIWTRDKSVKKERALLELAYIYFMEDPRSDYQLYVDRDVRSLLIKEGEGLPEKWEPDEVVIAAMEYFCKLKPTAALLLEDTRVAVDKLRDLLRTISFDDIEDSTKLALAMNSYTATIKLVPVLVKSLDEAEKALAKELMQSDKVRGALEKAMYEDI